MSDSTGRGSQTPTIYACDRPPVSNKPQEPTLCHARQLSFLVASLVSEYDGRASVPKRPRRYAVRVKNKKTWAMVSPPY